MVRHGDRLFRRRALGIVASAAAHAVVLVLLAWHLGRAPPPAEAPAFNVELVTLPPREPRKPPAQGDRAARTEAALRLHIAPVVTPSADALPIVPPPAPDGEAGVRQALRGRLGCQHAALVDLSPEERRRCQESLAVASGRPDPAAPKLNLDRRGTFAENPEPYLSRRPKNGCKVRAAGTADPMGKEGPAAGVSCAWSF